MPACQTLAPTHLETPFAVPTRLDGAPYKADKVTVKRKSGYQDKKWLSRQKVAVKRKRVRQQNFRNPGCLGAA